jgi:hypothetical protein
MALVEFARKWFGAKTPEIESQPQKPDPASELKDRDEVFLEDLNDFQENVARSIDSLPGEFLAAMEVGLNQDVYLETGAAFTTRRAAVLDMDALASPGWSVTGRFHVIGRFEGTPDGGEQVRLVNESDSVVLGLVVVTSGSFQLFSVDVTPNLPAAGVKALVLQSKAGGANVRVAGCSLVLATRA